MTSCWGSGDIIGTYITKSKNVVLGTENLFSTTDNQNRSTENFFKLIGRRETISDRRKSFFKLIGRQRTISGRRETF